MSKKLTSLVVSVLSIIGLAVWSTAGVAGASGGSSSANYPSDPSPCVSTWEEAAVYPLLQPNESLYPLYGVGHVRLVQTSVPQITAVCASPGWTVSAKAVTGGFQLAYKNVSDTTSPYKTLDMKYVLGKTDIRLR
jgi:hypothetical protein